MIIFLFKMPIPSKKEYEFYQAYLDKCQKSQFLLIKYPLSDENRFSNKYLYLVAKKPKMLTLSKLKIYIKYAKKHQRIILSCLRKKITLWLIFDECLLKNDNQ